MRTGVLLEQSPRQNPTIEPQTRDNSQGWPAGFFFGVAEASVEAVDALDVLDNRRQEAATSVDRRATWRKDIESDVTVCRLARQILAESGHSNRPVRRVPLRS